MSYGQIAAILGNPRLSRRVGQAMFCAPSERKLPCHRVVKKSGELAPPEIFSGRQRQLLKKEGVVFRKNGSINMELSVWEDAWLMEAELYED